MPVAEKTSTWTLAKSGSFWVAANWSNGVPDASTDALITASGTYTVTSSETGVIDALSTAAGATLAITDDSSLTVTNGTQGLASYTDYGWINVGLGSSLNIGGSFNLTHARLYSAGDTTIDNATIKLSTAGVIASNGGTVTLAHDNIVMDSSSQLRGGVKIPLTAPPKAWVLDVTDSVVSDGQILYQGGNVFLTDDALYGVYIDAGVYGSFHVEGLSNLFDGSGTPMNITGQVTVEDGAALTLTGAIHTVSEGVNVDYVVGNVDDDLYTDAEPELFLNSSSASTTTTELLIKGTATLSGHAPPIQQPGYFPLYNNAIELSDSPNNIIDGAGPGPAVLNNINDVIEGSGHIGLGDGSLSVINKYWINADGDDYGLYIDLGSATTRGVLTNKGTIEASLHGDLDLVNTNVVGGIAYIADSGSMELQGSSHLSVVFAGYIEIFGNQNDDDYTESLTLDTPFDNSFTTGGSTISFYNDDYLNLVGLNFLSGSTHATYTWAGGSGLLEVTNGRQTVDLTVADGTDGNSTSDFTVSKYTLGGQTGTTVKFVA